MRQAEQACLVVIGVLVLGSLLAAQTAQGSMAGLANVAVTAPAPAVPQPYSMDPDLLPPEAPDTYQVGPDDLLSIFVFQMPSLTSQVRVGSQGQIRLPLMARTLEVSGMTPPEISRAVEAGLAQQGLAREPVVRVVVRQVMSRPITVAGAVRNPEVIQASRPIRLVEAIARAGGLSSDAGTDILVTHTGPDGAITQRIPASTLMSSTDPDEDPLLTGGETVRVQLAQYIYAVGALQKPDAFTVSPQQPMTVLRVLALAQGVSTTSPANLSHSVIIRVTDGQQERIPVNLNKILKRSSPDVALRAGDILFVPVNGKRKLLDSALGLVGQATAIALGYRAF